MRWAIAITVLLLTAAVGVQTYRLRGVEGERDLLALQKTERTKRDAMRELAVVKNKERTDEESHAARRRAAAVVVRGKPGGAGIRTGKTVEFAGGGDDRIACFDRGRLNAELAGWMERHAAGLNAAIAATAQLGNRRFTGVAVEGEGVAADYRACRAWALNLTEAMPPLYSSPDKY